MLLFDGELSNALSDEVNGHIGRCADCASFLEALRLTSSTLRSSADIEFSETWSAKTAAAVRSRVSIESEWSVIEKTAEKIFVALALIVILLMSFGPTNGDVPDGNQVSSVGFLNLYIQDTTVARMVASSKLSKDDVLAAALHRP